MGTNEGIEEAKWKKIGDSPKIPRKVRYSAMGGKRLQNCKIKSTTRSRRMGTYTNFSIRYSLKKTQTSFTKIISIYYGEPRIY